MNNQFIQRVIFDWNRIDNDSYLKEIEAFKGIEKLDFNKPITFFVGENGSIPACRPSSRAMPPQGRVYWYGYANS